MLFESLNISQHFRTLYALVSRPSCSTGKVAAQHRKTPYRAAQRFSALVANRHQVQLLRSIRETKTACLFRRVPLKNPEVYIFVLGTGRQIDGTHTDTATSPAEPPCISSGSFPKEQAERLREQHRSFLGRVYARLDCGACLAVRPITQK